MDRKHSRVAVPALVATLLLSASACGGDGDSASSSGGGGGSDDSPIKVGFLSATSGPYKTSSDNLLTGINYWIDQDGEIDGHPVELVTVDDGGTPATAVPAMQRLIQEEQVDFVIGPWLSGPSTAVLGPLNQRKVVNINLSALAAAGDVEQYPYNFHIEFAKDDEGGAMLREACDLGASSIATIVVNNPLGTETDASIQDNLDDAPCDLEYNGSQQFGSGSTDARAQATAVQEDDVVVVGAQTPADFAAVINSLDEIGFEGHVMGNALLAADFMQDLVAPGIQDRVIAFGYTPESIQPLSEETQGWLDGISAALGEETDVDAQAYDAMVLLDQAVTGAGSTDADAVTEWLESNEVCGVQACFEFSADSHQGLQADDNVPAAFASAVDGFAPAYESGQ